MAATVDSVATVDNVDKFSLQTTISHIEQRLDTARLDHNIDDDDDDDDNDVMPAVASQMAVGQSTVMNDQSHLIAQVSDDDDDDDDNDVMPAVANEMAVGQSTVMNDQSHLIAVNLDRFQPFQETGQNSYSSCTYCWVLQHWCWITIKLR